MCSSDLKVKMSDEIGNIPKVTMQLQTESEIPLPEPTLNLFEALIVGCTGCLDHVAVFQDLGMLFAVPTDRLVTGLATNV